MTALFPDDLREEITKIRHFDAFLSNWKVVFVSNEPIAPIRLRLIYVGNLVFSSRVGAEIRTYLLDFSPGGWNLISKEVWCRKKGALMCPLVLH